jgi:hypothetical protein
MVRHSSAVRTRPHLRVALTAVVLLCGLVLADSQHIVTDYYDAEITPEGSLNVYALTGRKLITDLPSFHARYLSAGIRQTLTGACAAPPTVQDQGDSLTVILKYHMGPASIAGTYSMFRHAPFIDCRLHIEYEHAIDSVFLEALEFKVWLDSAVMNGRDQALHSLYRRHHCFVADRWTTKAVRFGQGLSTVTLTGEDNMLGLRVLRRPGYWQADYTIDEALDHPLFTNYRYPHRPAFDTSGALHRAAGSKQDVQFRIAVGREMRILKKERQPSGYEATLVLTEHADCEGPVTTRAIAYGRSDASAPIPGRGILGNGLTWTKSVFRWHTSGSRYSNLGFQGLDSPDFKEVIDRLYGQGVEIALHSPTVFSDSPGRVATALRDLKGWYQSKVWIDHGADHNREALARFGALRDSQAWYIADTLKCAGFPYAWLAIDAENLGVWGNAFAPGSPGIYPPILYPMPGTDLYLWSTICINNRQDRDYHLNPDGIKRLVRERGLDILHVYFGGQDTFIGRPGPGNAGWLKVSGDSLHRLWETDHSTDHSFQFIAQEQQAGRLRVATLFQLADYLLLSDSVEIRTLGANEFQVVNHATRPIPGFALSTTAREVGGILVGGQESRQMKEAGKDVLFWFDLPALGSRYVQIAAPDKGVAENAANPFSRSTRIYWQVPRAGLARVSVFAPSGRRVRTISQGWLDAGTYSEIWNGTDDRGAHVPPGTYICLLEGPQGTASVKTVLLR